LLLIGYAEELFYMANDFIIDTPSEMSSKKGGFFSGFSGVSLLSGSSLSSEFKKHYRDRWISEFI
jgi:hypothetical protein